MTDDTTGSRSRTRRAVLYCRVSTDEQAEHGTSLADQARRCERYALDRGWQVVDRFVDEGVSGATPDRPALNRLVSAAGENAFDVVVVTDPDRLSRDLVDGLVIERELASSAVEVVYLIQPAMSTLERQLRGVIAEEERRKIRDRVSRGQRSVAEAGYWPGGPPPYGYKLERAARGRARLAINPAEAAVITAIIDAFLDDGLTTHEIATELNAKNVPTPGASRRTSGAVAARWSHQRVRATLAAAERLAGTWTYSQHADAIEVPIPPIVTPTRAEQIRARLSATSSGPRRPTRRHFFLFAQRITSACGAPMYCYARPDSSGHAYRCSNRSPERGPDQCDCRPANALIVETAAWDTIAQQLTNPRRLARLAGLAATATTKTGGDDDLAAIDRKIRRIETALATQIAELLAAGTDPGAITRAKHQLENQLRDLRQHRTRLIGWAAQRHDHATQLARLHRLAESARNALLHPSDELKAHVIDLLDTRIRVLRTDPCPTCLGKGLLPRNQTTDEWARHHTGSICPTCRRAKAIPIIEISGLLPIIDHLSATPDAPTVAFRLRAAN